jgi:hypothetical protein
MITTWMKRSTLAPGVHVDTGTRPTDNVGIPGVGHTVETVYRGIIDQPDGTFVTTETTTDVEDALLDIRMAGAGYFSAKSWREAPWHELSEKDIG